MIINIRRHNMNIKYFSGLLFAGLLIVASSCTRDVDLLEPAEYPTDAEVYLDSFAGGLDYQAFSNSKLDAISDDSDVKYKGTASLKVTVPSEGDLAGWYSGGAFIAPGPRDLTGYDALTFWAKASMPTLVGLVGFGNDNTGTSLYQASLTDIVFTTSWQKFIVPIPLASKLGQEKGMFQFSAGALNKLGYDIWFDEVQFEKLGTIAQPRPVIAEQELFPQVGDEVSAGVSSVIMNAAGKDLTVNAMPNYFTFISSDESVAKVNEGGIITAVAEGEATITVKLGSVEASQPITVKIGAAPPGPATAAPMPTRDAANVISLFSNAYTNNPVDTWSADWDQADVADKQINGDDVKVYSNLAFAGIDFSSQQINASSMTNLYMDFWTPDPTASPAAFKIKLVDFGADGAFGGGDDSEHELVLTASSTPAITSNAWASLDIPLSAFSGLANRGNLSQLIIAGDPNTVYLDNIYFHNEGDNGGSGGNNTEPATAAPMPTADAADVVSLYSNVYTNATIDTWSAEWDQADVEDAQVAGDDVKLYTNLVFAGVEFTSQTVDASAMTHFHMDIWTPDNTDAPTTFKVKLVDFGANGVWDGGGDDVEHELTFDASTTPALATGSWVAIDVPLSDFTNLTTTGHLSQLIISGEINTVYVDNIYFYKGDGSGGGSNETEPSTAAPAPGFDAANVISLYSNAYSNVAIDTWSAEWDQADVADVQVAGDDAKLYTNLVFAGIEFTSSTINASDMTHFYMNIWTPDPADLPAVFKIKLVDFGANGVWDGGGDDVEHELVFDASTTPALEKSNWITFDIPLSDFTNMTTKEHLAQLIISGDPNTVYVDNILLHK
ncbi:MAG: hypothetical protein DWQ10_10520 [Calditrichaeota bacterium]|nr:MAG: hypothetical protein DWQ10_10520 [Calditrichota bacterium]